MNLNIQLRIILILLTVGSIAPSSYSQLPTYSMTLSNDSVYSRNAYEFDIYLLNTSTNVFQLFGFQIGILYDSTFLNGGTLTASWVPGSNDTSLASANQVSNTINTTKVGIIRIDPKISMRFGKGTIISNASPGTKIGRLRLTSTKPFNSQKANISWSFALPWKTMVAAYDFKTHLSTDITVLANHFISFHKQFLPAPGVK
jgi:hypothetical protein